MRILILGANGLIGHTLWEQFSGKYDTFATVRMPKSELVRYTSIFNSDKVIDRIDINELSQLKGVLKTLKPDYILNCTGITKRRNEINQVETALTINSIFPHKLAQWCLENGSRSINFSTDCVFHGENGDYNEQSITTAEDNYGRSKAFGEVKDNANSLTIRSSFIGRELLYKSELLEWFISQNGKTVKGFKNAMYSGVSTIYMSKVVSHIIDNYPALHGLYQLAPEQPISKYDLLHIARKSFGLNIEIVPEEDFVSNKSLNGTKLKNKINIEVPTWQSMMDELAITSPPPQP